MPSIRHKNILPSRRRRDDEDDEEGSVVADVEDDSLSEGSPISTGDDDADVEGSEASEQEIYRGPDEIPAIVSTNGVAVPTNEPNRGQAKELQPKRSLNGVFKNSADTDAMLNGLKISDDAVAAEEIHFEDTAEEMPASSLKPVQALSEVIRQETPAERNRREHQEYLKKRDENPAFVPNRGGFFLHDNRSAAGGVNGVRAFARGRGRGSFGGVHSSRGVMQPELTEQQWAHDLHDSTLKTEQSTSASASAPPSTVNGINATAIKQSVNAAPLAPTPPNRSFSTSTVVGNVPVNVYLPGMPKRIAVKTMAKKQHTLLPQHRPPLRRDKPVRISLPDDHPRYIFPSVERSFIFIPRALRPNQQSFSRGRGRGSFAGSRRTSVYGGSTYSPSIAMSRRSSLVGGASQNGIRSPATGGFPRPPGAVTEAGKPVVRLPPMARQNMAMPMPAPSSVGSSPFMTTQTPSQPLQPQLAMNQNQQTAIPMHQPRPQKAVSVADIESPTTFSYNPPQQQQEQPFHQQVPTDVAVPSFGESSITFNSHSRRPSHPSQPSGTPLSHIPERAIYAPSFQPYAFAQPAGYFAAPYPPGALFYPPMGGEVPGYSGAGAAPAMAPAFVPGAPYMLAPPPPAPPSTDPGAQGGTLGTVAHESNGMVYYYNSTQLQQATSPGVPPPYPSGGVVGMGGMITPPAHFYYPQAPNGVYFGPH